MDEHSKGSTNGHALGHQSSRPNLPKRTDTFGSGQSAESAGYLAPARINALNRQDSFNSDTGSAPDSLLDLYGDKKNTNGVIYKDDEDPERSRWIHRDKLARIESQELQAAGIILPRARATSKSSRRDTSRDQQGNGSRSEQAGQKRQRMESFPSEEEEMPESNDWDLRSPEEAAEDVDRGDLYQDVSGGVKGVSRIPVSKTSPIPIPFQHLERHTPMRRTQNGVWGEEDSASLAISNPKSRGRSGSVQALQEASATPTPAKRFVSEHSTSPTKKGAKKITTPANRATSNQQRPKTRSGTITRETSGAQRPPTRSGDVKRPEGDPPWLSTMYKPDPRLPPDQQLLPTVAKRLQQEQWEKEGKFGNAYDTSFRPINDEQFHLQPEPPQQLEVGEGKEEHDGEWPLRSPKSPAPSTGRPGTAGGYSTLPKIHTTGTPQGVSLPSPKPAMIRMQEQPEDAKKGGCGCCVVM
ncbi:hypothetical protein D0Z07_6476 [Hyphodiscus hymeniophilus]|uniref:TeaA receptor TeaR n=1 Tax=Hyphodiscus hymeniophilus TaxID=353542 RepID=A0A9P6VFQ9_9HELO|nr:hypothetical protein D0Z07_6476 [Hyphodiscus hymeniophilus]